LAIEDAWFDRLTMNGPEVLPFILSLSKDAVPVANKEF
jgi:hypothetical protein